MRIRYLGWLATDNLGDLGVYRALQALFEPDVLSTEPAGPDSGHGAVMIGGGTLLFRNACAGEAASAAEDADRLFVFGAGAGDPEFGEVLKPEPWKHALERSFFVGVRGFRSRQILEELGFRGHVEVIGDPALLLQSALRAGRGEGGHRRMVINICFARRSRLWGSDNDAVRDAVVEAARRLLKSDWSLTFVSFEPRDDWYVRSAVSALESPGRVVFVQGHKSLQGTLDLIAAADLVVGERLHSTVFASAVGTPFISLEYRPKCRDFAQTVELEEMVIRTDRLTASEILDRVRYAESNQAGIGQRLRRSVAIYREKLRKASLKVKEALQRTVKPLPACQ